MNIDIEKLLETAVRDGFVQAVTDKSMAHYDNPFKKLLELSIQDQNESLRALVGESVQKCVSDPAFRAEVATGIRSMMVNTLVARFGGELQKTVNSLKSDPTTRARITLAIEEIIKQKTVVEPAGATA